MIAAASEQCKVGGGNHVSRICHGGSQGLYTLYGLCQSAEVIGEHIADVANAESVGLRYFPRVDYEALGFQLSVKVLEVEIS